MSRPRPKIPEPLRAMAAAARGQQWTVTYTGGGHRSIANCLAKLRSAGLTLGDTP